MKKLESVVNVQTDKEKMEKLFDKNVTYVIRYAEKIGEQDGIFNYESFLKQFDKPFERDENVFVPLSKDINLALEKLNKGISAKNVRQELEKRGSSYCKNKFYVKAVMKSEEVQQVLREIEEKNKSTERTR